MTIYLDLIFLLNFIIDFLIIVTESIVLKNNTKFIKLVLSSLVGSLSLVILFINFDTIFLFIIKLFISIIMVLIAFGYKNIKYVLTNVIYFLFISILYGGFLYFIIYNINYKNYELSFVKNNFDINLIFLVILSPVILYIYIKQIKEKYKISLRVKVSVYINSKEIILNGFIDSGNNLKDPYKNRDVMITDSKEIKNYILKSQYILIPYETIGKKGFLKASLLKKVIVDDKVYNDILIAFMEEKIKIDGIDIILNNSMIGG